MRQYPSLSQLKLRAQLYLSFSISCYNLRCQDIRRSNINKKFIRFNTKYLPTIKEIISFDKSVFFWQRAYILKNSLLPIKTAPFANLPFGSFDFSKKDCIIPNLSVFTIPHCSGVSVSKVSMERIVPFGLVK